MAQCGGAKDGTQASGNVGSAAREIDSGVIREGSSKVDTFEQYLIREIENADRLVNKFQADGRKRLEEISKSQRATLVMVLAEYRERVGSSIKAAYKAGLAAAEASDGAWVSANQSRGDCPDCKKAKGK
jgi:hypothetical protein